MTAPSPFSPLAAWMETRHLSLGRDGRLGLLAYEVDDDGEAHYDRTEDLGPIGLAEVGPELAGELAELLDRWRDSPSMSDLHREGCEEYRATRGC